MWSRKPVAENLVIYSLVHQPRRVRLPARPIPKAATPEEVERLLFDSELDKHYLDVIAKWSYKPACETWRRMLQDGMKLGIGFSMSALRQFELWHPDLLEDFQGLVAHPNAELIGVEPYHGVSLLFDLRLFIQLMQEMKSRMRSCFGVEPVITDTTEMMMSSDVYAAIEAAGFSGTFMDGRPWVMEWRSAAHLYHSGGGPKILVRHFDLSDDVGYRFSNKGWDGWPLTASDYATRIADVEGEVVTLAWDFETFGHHHDHGSGIFEFLAALPAELKRRGVRCLTPGEAVAALGPQSHDIPLPPFPVTWAGLHGGQEFFVGNDLQQAVFRLMVVAMNHARLLDNPEFKTIALWLLQSDNLHWLQWVAGAGSEAEVSAYFTPKPWRRLGVDRMVWEHQCVYKNFIDAMTRA